MKLYTSSNKFLFFASFGTKILTSKPEKQCLGIKSNRFVLAISFSIFSSYTIHIWFWYVLTVGEPLQIKYFFFVILTDIWLIGSDLNAYIDFMNCFICILIGYFSPSQRFSLITRSLSGSCGSINQLQSWCFRIKKKDRIQVSIIPFMDS